MHRGVCVYIYAYTLRTGTLISSLKSPIFKLACKYIGETQFSSVCLQFRHKNIGGDFCFC